jgi:hypothetical protein
MFFNKSKFNFKDKQSFDDYLKLINSEEYGKTLRYWGRIEFYMKHVIPILMPDKKHAELTISGDYNPEDAIEGFTGWTLFKSNPISGRGVTIKICFQENDKKHTVITILNYMSYVVDVGNGSLIYGWT